MNKDEFADAIHMEIHAARRIPNYKPSVIERNISKFVIALFSEKCQECKDAGERLKNPQAKSGFLNKLGDAFKDGDVQF